MEWSDFLHAGLNSGKLKVILLISEWVWSKWACRLKVTNVCCILRMRVWTELIFCMLIVMQYFYVRPTLYSISLTFKCQCTPVLLLRPLVVARRVLWNRVCPPSVLLSFQVSSLPFLSFSPCYLLVVLLELGQLISLDYHGDRPIWSCACQLEFFLNNFFCFKYWGNGPKKPKIVFFRI